MRFALGSSILWLGVAGMLAPSSASSAPLAVHFEVAAVARSIDLVRISGMEPDRAAMPGVEAELSAAIPRSGLDLLIGGGIGGSWYYQKGPNYNLRTSYTEFRGQMGVQTTPLRSTHADLEVAALAEYGELRSWLEDIYFSGSGPRSHYVGGGLRVRAVGQPIWQLRPTVGFQADLYHARGEQSVIATKYSWLGEALTLSLGVRY